jgi:hypothetical protein
MLLLGWGKYNGRKEGKREGGKEGRREGGQEGKGERSKEGEIFGRVTLSEAKGP